MATSIVKILRVVADPNRLRILLLLKAEELSVAELQEILVMGQSTISTHLSQLKQAGLVEDRRTGKSNLYRYASPATSAAWEKTTSQANHGRAWPKRSCGSCRPWWSPIWARARELSPFFWRSRQKKLSPSIPPPG